MSLPIEENKKVFMKAGTAIAMLFCIEGSAAVSTTLSLMKSMETGQTAFVVILVGPFVAAINLYREHLYKEHKPD